MSARPRRSSTTRMPALVDFPDLGPVLVLAPVGRDAAEIARVLGGIGLRARAIPGVAALCHELRVQGGAEVAALIIAEEALATGTATIAACLAEQPPWSDLPIVVLTASGQRRGPEERWRLFEGLGNVTLLSRPLHAETLHSAARAARRARARQHEPRQHLDAMRIGAETLEARVEERTRELMAMEETLRQSQKMEAVGHLTGGLAHDFNNLLAGISGSLELMQMRLKQGRITDLDGYIRTAETATQRAAALTHRLLAFSRRQTLDPKPIAANRLILNMMELISRSVGPQVTVETKLAVDLVLTLCDAHQLENAVLNLCINAKDAMPAGGRLFIETTNIAVDDCGAQPGDMAPGSYLVVSVIDTGTGMTPEVVARAFDPFFTTKPLGKGTGLGLSMIYGFAKQSGGKVEIHSELGGGTTVRLYLPCYVGRLEDEEARPEQATAARANGGETVLVVDDEPAVRMLVTDVLKEAGYAVIEAADGFSGLRVLQSNARIDLLISDVGMPGGMSGWQMADAGRDVRPELKVLFITGYAEETRAGDGHMKPGMHIMTKPFTLAALGRQVRNLISATKHPVAAEPSFADLGGCRPARPATGRRF